MHSRYRQGFQSAWPTLASWVLIGIVLFMSLKFDQMALLILAPIVWLACYIWELSTLPLQPITHEEAVVAKRYGNIFLIIVFSIGVVAIAASNL